MSKGIGIFCAMSAPVFASCTYIFVCTHLQYYNLFAVHGNSNLAARIKGSVVSAPPNLLLSLAPCALLGFYWLLSHWSTLAELFLDLPSRQPV